jgi:hypothetical protein
MWALGGKTERMMKMKWFYVDVHWLDDSMQDAILGINEEDAVESAYKNWPDAININLVEGKTQEPTPQQLKRYKKL